MDLGILLDAMTVGKRLPDAIYLHVACLDRVDDAIRARVGEAARVAGVDEHAFNVVKLGLDGKKISLLSYPSFFDSAFPELAMSWAVDLARKKATVRQYSADDNVPVLHRKETLLPQDHALRDKFAALTLAAERYGLFEDAQEIGLKAAWEAKLARARLRVVDHRLVEVAPEDAEVMRHKTALTRYGLSTPMQTLWRHGFLDGGYTVFDYGCGRGDDVSALRGRGLTVNGWDPHYAQSEPKTEADVVNLGFVLNVIEDLHERRDALTGAYQLAKKVLTVAVLIGGRTMFERYRLFRDGVLTQRGTFQKYFSQSEIRQYLEETLGREPVAVAPGIFFVFRGDEEEQRFLVARQRSYQPVGALPTVPRERPVPGIRLPRAPRERKPTKWELHRELLDAFYARALELGRVPEPEEFERAPELRVLGRPQTVLARAIQDRGGAEFEAAREAKRADLLVYLALNVFERRRSFGALPEIVRRDVRAFWGNYTNAQTEAQGLLFAAGKVDVIHAACKHAAGRGLGYLDADHSLQLHSSMTLQLPAILRIYLGCAARLYGAVEEADVVKIHIQSGKVTLMMYDDFEGKAIPNLIERVKINLRRQDIDFFEYGEETPLQPLYLKSRLIGPNFPRYTEQVAFDDTLKKCGLFDLRGFGPSVEVLARGLEDAGLEVGDFELRKRRKSRRDPTTRSSRSP